MSVRFQVTVSSVLIYTVLLGCVYIFGLFYQHGDAAIESLYLPANINILLTTHAYWQLLTPVLIHFGFVHLSGNLFVWWYLARIIGSVSPGWLFGIFLSSALVSNLAQWFWQAGYFGGLSGVIAALIGFMACYQWLRPSGIFYIRWHLVIGFIVTITVVSSGYFGVYSNAAHFAGLFWGGLLAVFYCRRQKP